MVVKEDKVKLKCLKRRDKRRNMDNSAVKSLKLPSFDGEYKKFL
jgi:hypothetical protein